ncbi:hypothetical protein R1flu_018231 [Riccia fluitans]|uniref:Uncharacterized protein n=1 Tax=Riccia fluitans TaxID=41844 RepID=A0ABD1ZFF3_9MARC
MEQQLRVGDKREMETDLQPVLCVLGDRNPWRMSLTHRNLHQHNLVLPQLHRQETPRSMRGHPLYRIRSPLMQSSIGTGVPPATFCGVFGVYPYV